MKWALLVVVLAIIGVLPGIQQAAAAQEPSTCILFFYGNGCPHCARVEPFLDTIVEKYPETDIRRLEVYYERQNAILLTQYFEDYGIDQFSRGVPALFVADKALIGDTPIISQLEEIIASNPNAPCPGEEGGAEGPSQGNATAIVQGEGQAGEGMQALGLATIIGAAVVDSINPCAIAVLLILMSALLAAGDRKRALLAGFMFTASIYISYFLFGLGIFSAIQVSGLSYWFYKAVGFIAIIIGMANIKDYFWYGGAGFVMEIPRRWRPMLKKMLGAVTSPLGAFLIGFVVCLFELPCTGGPYIFILGLLADKATMAGAIPLLLLYNVFFVLPLIILTLLIYMGFSNVEHATQWKDRNIRVLHLVAGLIMLALGLLVVLGLV